MKQEINSEKMQNKERQKYYNKYNVLHFAYKTRKTIMETAMKVSTSFRLNAELVARMKKAAKASNRSLNNYVESILLNVMANEPNETTQRAIREAMDMQVAHKSGTLEAKPIDLSSVDNMLRSMDL